MPSLNVDHNKMLAPSQSQQTCKLSPASQPRRKPAHLPVSLRHSSSGGSGSGSGSVPLLSSAASNDTGDFGGMTAEKWFERSNKLARYGAQANIDDGEPPFIFPRTTTFTGISMPHELGGSFPNADRGMLASNQLPSANGNSVDDYRSVIDDLTIENQKLKERLRKYEPRYNPDLEQDRMFELKIHRGIPSQKLRELEETLQAFVSSVDGHSDRKRSRANMDGRSFAEPSRLRTAPQGRAKKSASSDSNSQPLDSAYASMSTHGPRSTSPSNGTVSNRAGSQSLFVDANSMLTKDQKVQCFLHDMPDKLLPKHAQAMTEKQRKKMVVKRLEQLFTGKVIGTLGDHNQPRQQQKISRAATAEQRSNYRLSPNEGNREAQIHEPEYGVNGRALLERIDSNDSGASSSGPTEKSSPDQRPTRPLDLDPDRAQIPLDNVEYIRHLGLSRPKLITYDNVDAEANAPDKGWTHLNLLYGMAQLHMINVTLDFVRSAVAGVSSKLQLSPDGREIRWRGGSEGSRLSSDSDNSARLHSPPDSDSYEESDHKRRKIEVFSKGQIHHHDSSVAKEQTNPSVDTNRFHYKPLFKHRNSNYSSTSMGDCAESMSNGPQSGTGPSWQGNGRSKSRSGCSSKRRRDGGPIVFYSGAKFCTDLSGDHGDISTPRHVMSVSKDGYSNHTQEVIGCAPPRQFPSLNRTTSGSLFPFRPFKDYSRTPDFLQTEETRPKTPELLREGSPDVDFVQDEAQPNAASGFSLQYFDACGLGGTQPADHFALTVTTRIARQDGGLATKGPKFATPNIRKYKHNVPKQSLEVFRTLEHDYIAAKLASLNTFSPPASNSNAKHIELPIKRDIISEVFNPLQPSNLPGPTAFFSDTSSSGCDDSDYDDSDAGIAHLRDGPSIYQPFDTFQASSEIEQLSHIAGPPSAMEMDDDEEKQDNEEEREEVESSGLHEEDDEESIDMLGDARLANPELLAEQERDFEEDVTRRKMETLPVISAADTTDESSGYSVGSDSS